MFGLGFGEMVILGIVLLVVVGPRELPKLLRSLGRGINKLRRMSSDLREQSGIDDIIQDEGLREDLDALRSLSRGRANVVEGLVNAAAPKKRRPQARPRPRNLAPPLAELKPPEVGTAPDPAKEYPPLGPDNYGALADDAPAPDSEPPKDDDPGDQDPGDEPRDDTAEPARASTGDVT